MRKIFFFLSLVLAACSGPPNGLVSYVGSGRKFSYQIPGDWKVLENKGEIQNVEFFGPLLGPHPFAASIVVNHYASSQYPTSRAYFNNESLTGDVVSPLSQKQVGERALEYFSIERRGHKIHSEKKENLTDESYLVPSPGGFYVLSYICSKASCASNEPVFLGLVESFKPLP